MNNHILIAILLLSPVLGFLLNGVRFKSTNYVLAGAIATTAVFVSFICSVLMFLQLLELPPEQRRIVEGYFEWISVGRFSVNASFVVDQISAIMILIITHKEKGRKYDTYQ